MKYRQLFLLAVSIPALSAVDLGAQAPPPAATPSGGLRGAPIEAQKKPEKLHSFKFEGADLDTVMTQYCEWTDKIYLKTDAIKSTITLKADKLPTSEAIKVVEAILAMNNIALVPMGDKYIKVVAANGPDLTGQGLSIQMDPELAIASGDKFITRVIQLQNVTIPEVQAAIQHVLHSYGKILTLERSNSIMITDTEANIKRASELIEFIDQATAQIEPRMYQIQFAEATEIAGKLNEIVTAAQGDEKKPTVTGNPYARTPAGVVRASVNAPKAPAQATVSKTEGNSTVIIQGTVKIMADERTNLIIVFSVKENFDFFDKIIKVLDVEVEPATTFEVINLEYADAMDLSGTLNDLIGAASSSRSSSSSASSSRAGSSASTSRNTTGTRNTGASARVTPNASPEGGTGAIQNLNRLSEDTKILADERSNSILLMGSKDDIAAIKQVIKSLDVMLEQVVIEAAIFEIGLTDSIRHGIDWLYRNAGDQKVGAWDGNSLIGSTNGIGSVAAGAMTYYQNLSGINTEIAINLAATDNDARLLATPVVMTTDNTEATLSIGEQRPVVTSTDSFANSTGTQRSNYEYRDIGIQLTVTPRINPQRFVVMELNQKADQLGGNVNIDGNEVPIILNREFGASIAVPDGGTVALGGLVTTEFSDNITKIPLLGDIPLLGRYLFSSVSKTETQRELVVLMTPYVMTNISEMQNETERLYKGTSLRQKDWKGSWSESKLRDLSDPVKGEGGEEVNREEKSIQESFAPTAEPVEPSTSSAPATSDDEEMRKLLKSMDTK